VVFAVKLAVRLTDLSGSLINYVNIRYSTEQYGIINRDADYTFLPPILGCSLVLAEVFAFLLDSKGLGVVKAESIPPKDYRA
jgi:hypothetical protein